MNIVDKIVGNITDDTLFLSTFFTYLNIFFVRSTCGREHSELRTEFTCSLSVVSKGWGGGGGVSLQSLLVIVCMSMYVFLICVV